MTASKTNQNGAGFGAQIKDQVQQLEKKAQAGLNKLEKEANARWTQIEKEANARWTQIEKEATKLGREANTRLGKLEQQARTEVRKIAKDLDKGLGGLQDQVLGMLGIASKGDIERLSKKVAGLARKVTGESDAA